MSMSISFSFRTREEALKQIAIYKSYMYPIYLALSSWIWNDKNGKFVRECNIDFDWLEHTDDVLRNLLSCADELFHFSTLPTMSRALSGSILLIKMLIRYH